MSLKSQLSRLRHNETSFRWKGVYRGRPSIVVVAELHLAGRRIDTSRLEKEAGAHHFRTQSGVDPLLGFSHPATAIERPGDISLGEVVTAQLFVPARPAERLLLLRRKLAAQLDKIV